MNTAVMQMTSAPAVNAVCSSPAMIKHASFAAPFKPSLMASAKVRARSLRFQRASRPAIEPEMIVCATSAPGLDTIVHGLAAVNGKQCPIRILVDTGATENCISEQFVSANNGRVRVKPEKLRMANGSIAASKGELVMPISMQTYSEEVVCKVLKMNEAFDMILGSGWIRAVQCDIMSTSNSLEIKSDHNGYSHNILIQPDQSGICCPIISAVNLHKHLDSVDDVTFLCSVTEVDTESENGQDQVQDLLFQYEDVFPDQLPDELPPIRNVFHTILLKDVNATPPARKTYRLSRPEWEECKKQITALLEKGHIQPSCSPYGSPVLFVRKASGELRMCVDYRALNEQTIKNKYPLPRIDELFDQLQGASVFSSIDLQSAYNQVRLKSEDIPKTAFTTPFGLFEFKVLCFGLTNAPGTFQNIMNDVLRPYLDKFVLVYLDDIVIFSKNREEHMIHLELVLQLLRKHKLYAKMSKCKFVQPELQFLGHIIGAKGLQVDPRKIAIVKDWPVPESRNELQKFYGLANYFRKFVLGWANLVDPLQQLLRKSKEYVWTQECNDAFTGLKDALCNAPVLALPDLNKAFEVVCDACGVGMGAVLLQEGKPVAFEGKRLSAAEQNYDVGEQEMLAVLNALELWRCYLDGTDFTVVTDHSPNTFFANKKLLSPRQRRWAERLSAFKFTWEYRPGRINVADPISRHPSFFGERDTIAAVLSAVSTDLSSTLACAGQVSAVYKAARARAASAKAKAASANNTADPANNTART